MKHCRRFDMQATTLGVVVGLAALSVAASRAIAQESGRVVIAAKTSLLRMQPSVEAKLVVEAERGTEFTVTGSSAGWVKVAIAGGGEGWLAKSEIGLKVKRAGGVCVEMSLKDAITIGAIDGGFRGTGSASGDAVTLRAKGALKLAICPQVHPGTILKNANAAAQNMVLRSLRATSAGSFIKPATELRFEPSVEAEYVFEAYCLDFDKDNPSEADRLLPTESVEEPVQRILNVRSSSILVTQLAVWAITDDITAADAMTKFEATDADIAAARQLVQSAGLPAERYRLFARKE